MWGDDKMLKAILSVALLALTPAGVAAPAPAIPAAKAVADPAPAIHKALQALYDAQDAALGRRNVPQAMAAYAPSYVAVGQDGLRHTRDEEFDALERLCAMGQNLHQHSRVEKIITRNGQASLVLHQQTVMDMFSPNTHQLLVLHTEGVSQELWVHTPQGWRLTFSKTVLQRSSTGIGVAAASPAVAGQLSARPRRAVSVDGQMGAMPKVGRAF